MMLLVFKKIEPVGSTADTQETQPLESDLVMIRDKSNPEKQDKRWGVEQILYLTLYLFWT